MPHMRVTNHDLRALRVGRGLTVAQAAEQLGATEAELTTWEAGLLGGLVQGAVRLALHYGVPMAELFAKKGTLRRARQQRGERQVEVAEATGVQQPLLSRWEGGAVPRAVQDALRVAAFYGVTAEELFAVQTDDVGPGVMDSGRHPAARPLPRTGTGG